MKKKNKYGTLDKDLGNRNNFSIENYEETPREPHTLAALSNIQEILPHSQVTIPSLDAVMEAKEFVDDHNQK